LLNLTKCAYYILAWTFGVEGRATYIPKNTIPNLRLTSGNNRGTEAVRQLNFDETHKYLGNHLCVNIQMTDAFQAMLVTSTLYSSHILCSNLSKCNTWIAYFTVYTPSMTYSLPVSHHSPKQLKKLQSKATWATLMKLGFDRNTAHRVVYGPSRYGGLGFRHLAVEQGIAQVELFIRHMQAGSTQGKLLRITLSWWQLVMGVSYPLLGFPAPCIPHQENH
jgi:hypothetical protein